VQEHGQTFVFSDHAGNLCHGALVDSQPAKSPSTSQFLWVTISIGLLLASSLVFPYLFRIAQFLGFPISVGAVPAGDLGLTLLGSSCSHGSPS